MIPGYFYGRQYRNAYLAAKNNGENDALATENGVKASHALHTIFNFIVITSFMIMYVTTKQGT